MSLDLSIFTPVPKVHAAVLDFKPALNYKNLNFPKLQKILKVAFAQRRKKIKTNLRDYRDLLARHNIDENLRAENLSISDFCKLAGS